MKNTLKLLNLETNQIHDVTICEDRKFSYIVYIDNIGILSFSKKT